MTPSKIKTWKRNDDYIKCFFFFPEVKNHAISRLLNACFAILNIATSFWLIQNCSYLRTKHGIHQNKSS